MRSLDNIALTGVRVTDEGYLEAFARTARTGVQTYLGKEVGRDDMETVAVYRPESSVFDKDSVSSFASIPITMGHPANLVKAEDWKKTAVGTTTGDVMRDGEFMRLGLRVMDADAVREIQDGKRELSAGYEHDLVWESGVAEDGTPYDCYQTNIRANHIAVVDAARAGRKARIGDASAVDYSADTWGSAPITREDEETHMATRKITVDGITHEVSDTAAQIIEKLQGAVAAKDAELTDMKSKHDKMKSERDDMEGKYKAAEKEAKDAAVTPEKLQQLVKDRAAVETRFKAITGKDADVKADDAALRRQAVEHHLGADAAKDMSDDAITGAFAAIKAGEGKADPIREATKDGIKSSDGVSTTDANIFKMAGVKMKKEQ